VQLAASKAGVSEEDYQRFIAFVSGFYANMSNYHNFGHQKFIPELDSATFLKILQSNPLYSDPNAFYKQVVDEVYPAVEKELFNIDKPYTCINFPEEGGITGYFGRNITKEDLVLVREFCNS